MDADQPRTVAKFKDSRFDFGRHASVVVDGVLYAFKGQDRRVLVSKYVNATDGQAMARTDLPMLAWQLEYFALCVVQGRYVVLTGGLGYKNSASRQVFIFDAKNCEWLTEASLPLLSTARYQHASCAIESSVFVFGGFDGHDYLNSLEHLELELAEETPQNEQSERSADK